jgi:hypothetical protein
MSPARFFRKYSRTLILVIMSALLVVFLVEPALMRVDRHGRSHGAVIAEAFGRPVSEGDQARARQSVRILTELNVQLPLLERESEFQTAMTYHLLTEEARRAGIRMSQDHAHTELLKRGLPPAHIDLVRERARCDLGTIYETFAEYMAVVELFQLQLGSMAASEPRVRVAYRNETQRAQVRMSVLAAAAFRSQVPEPTEQELLGFFEAAKDRDTTVEDERMVFGYRLPARVRVEYVTLDPAKIQEDVRVSTNDVRRFYEGRKAQLASLLPAELRAAPPEFDQLPAEVQSRIREQCRAQSAILEAQKLVNAVRDEARRAGWDIATRDESGFHVPPEQTVSFADLARKYSSQYAMEYHDTGMVELSKLSQEPGLGRARLRSGQGELGVRELAARVKGLYTPDPNERAPVLNVNEPSEVLVELRPSALSPGGAPVPYQSYVLRVAEVVPPGPPASLAEVRERVTEDYVNAKAFDVAGARARALADRAREVGLSQAVAEADELRDLLATADARRASESQPAAPGPGGQRFELDANETFMGLCEPHTPVRPITRNPTFVDGLGYVPQFSERVFELAGDGGSAPAARATTVPVPERLRWTVVELVEVDPIYAGDFQNRREDFSMRDLRMQGQQLLMLWFSAEQVRARAGYRELR